MGELLDKIEAANKGFLDAFNSGDLAAAMEVYTKDATILPPNADMMKGKEAITAYWQVAVNMGVKKAELETVMVVPMGDKAAYEVGKYVLKIKPSGAEELTDHGKYLMIWKLVGDKWKWDIDAWNSSLPAT